MRFTEVDFSELKKLRQPTIFSSKNQFGRRNLQGFVVGKSLLVAHEYLEWLIFSATMPKAKNQSLPPSVYYQFLRSRLQFRSPTALMNLQRDDYGSYYMTLVLRFLLLILLLIYTPKGIPMMRDKVIPKVSRIILYTSRNTIMLIPTIVKPVKINAVLIIRLVRTDKYDLNLMFFPLNFSLIILEM